MNIFDIIGPVMVGPSSSHTAGAVKIGYVARKLLGEPVREAEINLYGSFLATGKGHGTNLALVAGLLGMKPDDRRIPDSLACAAEAGMHVTFGEVELKEAHPNSVQIRMKGVSGKELEIIGESIGGSLINIAKIDGNNSNFSGDHPTLIVYNVDKPGYVASMTALLSEESVNIATMHLYRSRRGGVATCVVECDQEISSDSIKKLENLEGTKKIIYYSLLEGEEK